MSNTDMNIIRARRKRTTLIPRKGWSKTVSTPPELAARVIAHFKPVGNILDPCRGDGAYFNQFPGTTNEWCDAEQGRDFYTFDFAGRRFDWCITTPPFSHFRAVLDRAMQVSDNIVLVCPINAIFMAARLRDLDEAGYGIREIARIDEQPSKPWPQSGLALGALHFQKGWTGDIRFGRLT